MANTTAEELQTRRDCLLSAIASIPQSLLRPYLSNPRVLPNCRLGYDTSPQCDSFQLGETLRFFVRKGLLSSNLSLLFSPEPAQPITWSGTLTSLIKTMKEMPNRQLNHHHQHCGIRSLLVRLLAGIELLLQRDNELGLCLYCFKQRKPKSGASWYRERHGGMWRGEMNVGSVSAYRFSGRHCEDLPCRAEASHKMLWKVFTADDWDWVGKI